MFSQVWKLTAGVLGVLVVILLIVALLFRGSAAVANAGKDAAIRERDQARAEVDGLKEARVRDVKAFIAASTARAAVDEHTAVSDQRATQIEVKYRDRIVEVPAVCPSPDADLLRDQQAQGQRLLAAEDRLRGIRRSPQEAAQ